MRLKTVAFFSGIFSGALGGLNGIAGSVINIPILTTFFKLSQHQAHGTTAVAALASSLIGSYSFYSRGGCYHSVDFPAAGAIGLVAMSVSPLGAMIGQRLSQKTLLYILSGVLFCAPPFLIMKDNIIKQQSPEIKSEQQSLVFASNNEKVALTGIALVTGFTSGIFGVGGGIILVPMLSMYFVNHQLAIGTSLAAMIPPLIMSSIVHKRLGNVASRNILLPLMIGSGVGAMIGSTIAMRITDKQQRIMFSMLMITLSMRNIFVARRLPIIIK